MEKNSVDVCGSLLVHTMRHIPLSDQDAIKYKYGFDGSCMGIDTNIQILRAIRAVQKRETLAAQPLLPKKKDKK